jgi:hypothetical protein
MPNVRKRLAKAARYTRAEEAVRIWYQRQAMMSSFGGWVQMLDGYNDHFANLTLKQANGILAPIYGFDSDEAFDKWLRRSMPRRIEPWLDTWDPDYWYADLYAMKLKPWDYW